MTSHIWLHIFSEAFLSFGRSEDKWTFPAKELERRLRWERNKGGRGGGLWDVLSHACPPPAPDPAPCSHHPSTFQSVRLMWRWENHLYSCPPPPATYSTSAVWSAEAAPLQGYWNVCVCFLLQSYEKEDGLCRFHSKNFIHNRCFCWCIASKILIFCVNKCDTTGLVWYHSREVKS